MEQYSDQPKRRAVEELATPEEVQELFSLADEFEHHSIDALSSESYRMTHNGGLVFRESLHMAGRIEVSETSLLIVDSDFLHDQEHASFVKLIFGEDPEAPPILDSEASMDELIQSRNLCIELLGSGRLDPVETQIALAAISHLAGYIETDYWAKQTAVTDYKGTAVGCAAAIRRVIRRRNPDHMHLQTYEHEDEEVFTRLTVNRYNPTNSRRYSDWPVQEIEFDDDATGQVYRLCRFIDGDIPVMISDSYGDPTPHWPDRNEIRQLRTAIIRALESEDILPPGVKTYEDLPEQPAWRGLVEDIKAANQALLAAAPDDIEARQRYEFSIESGMQQLTQEFEAAYHLVNQCQKPDLLGVNLERLGRLPIVGGWRLFRNTLLMRTPVAYEVDSSSPTGYKSTNLEKHDVVLLHYTNLSFEDPTGGSGKDVYVIGLASKKPGHITIRAIPLSANPDPIYAHAPLNN